MQHYIESRTKVKVCFNIDANFHHINKNTGLLNTDRMYFFVDKMSTFTLVLLDLTTCPI